MTTCPLQLSTTPYQGLLVFSHLCQKKFEVRNFQYMEQITGIGTIQTNGFPNVLLFEFNFQYM